jgi:hypothetical protein
MEMGGNPTGSPPISMYALRAAALLRRRRNNVSAPISTHPAYCGFTSATGLHPIGTDRRTYARRSFKL